MIGGALMATSSIFANVKIIDPKKAEVFIDALDASAKEPKRKPKIDGKEGYCKMRGFVTVNILDMIEAIGEDRVKQILSDFSCPKN